MDQKGFDPRIRSVSIQQEPCFPPELSASGVTNRLVSIWIISFIDAMQQGTTGLLTPYVYSDFSLHSLTAAASIMSSLISGLIKLPLAKVLDIWGRPQGFIIMVGFQTIGLIMMAACNGVKTYAAAQVFYWVGYVQSCQRVSSDD